MTTSNRIAFVKFGGLSAGGTERWLQDMAVSLSSRGFEIDYFYCDTAPYIGSDYSHPGTDLNRLHFMKQSKVNLFEFHVGFKDITKSNHQWIDTNFWDIFDENKYLFVQTGKAGPAEYPYDQFKIPVIEFVALSAGVDKTPNIAWTIHLSQWQRREWGFRGGNLGKSSMIPIPVKEPTSNDNLRLELNIPLGNLVMGFHQRVSDSIFSPVPLNAFAKVQDESMHFVIMGGGEKYRHQAVHLGLKNIIFIDHDSDSQRISKFLNTLDIYAHGRKDGETFGTVIAEAMIHRVPTLSHYSNKGANAQPETIGPSGFFAKNEREYEEYLLLLTQNADLRADLGNRGSDHARKYYSLEGCSDSLVEIYSKLFSEKGLNFSNHTSHEYGISSYGFLMAGELANPASLANNVLVGGRPEEFDVELLYKLHPKNRAFIDVGANIGLYSSVFAHRSPGMEIHAFEPQKDCIAELSETIHLNRWENSFKAWQLALSDENGNAELQESGTGSSLNRNFNNDDNLVFTSVATMTFDTWVSQFASISIGSMKIDVEGHEFEVLKGATDSILKHKPILFIEIAKTMSDRAYVNDKYMDTLNILSQWQYKIFRISSNNRLKILKWSTAPDGVSMYLCLPKDFRVSWVSLLLMPMAFALKVKFRRIVRLIEKLRIVFFKGVRIVLRLLKTKG